MNKMIPYLLGVAVLMGCAAGREKIEMYAANPQYLLKDPAFADYRQKLEVVEKRYLNKEITYAEYLELREELDQEYSQTIQQRSGDVAPEDM